MKAIASVVAVILALVVSQAAPASTGGGAAASKASGAVNIDNFTFSPHKLNVSTGTTVIFSNSDSRAHTATDKGVFDTGRIKPGHSASVRFTQKGTFSYHCKIHPEMTGKIVVG